MGGTIVRRALCLLVLAGMLAAAACGDGDDDDDDAAGDEATTTVEESPGATGTTLGGNATAQRSEEAQGYVDAITEAAAAGGGVSQSKEQNRCFAETYVDTVGVESLVAAISVDDLAGDPGFTPDNLGIVMTPAQEDTFYAGLQRCIDAKGFFVGVVAEAAALSPDQSACLATNLDDNALKLILVAPFDGDTAAVENDQTFQAIIDGLIAACPDAMAAAGVVLGADA
jgi:hypothetical protein